MRVFNPEPSEPTTTTDGGWFEKRQDGDTTWKVAAEVVKLICRIRCPMLLIYLLDLSCREAALFNGLPTFAQGVQWPDTPT